MDQLTQRDVDEYVRLDTQIKVLEAERVRIRERVVPWLKEHPCPASGPYRLMLVTLHACAHSWKDICEAVVANLGPVHRTKAESLIESMREIKADAYQLRVTPNAAFITSNAA